MSKALLAMGSDGDNAKVSEVVITYATMGQLNPRKLLTSTVPHTTVSSAAMPWCGDSDRNGKVILNVRRTT